MKLMSLALDGHKLSPVEVEVLLLPGLPQIHFLGLPDQVIRESIHRVKSAIRHQGFEFPKTKQILVNIRPSHTKKKSRGLDLAVAAGILWETDQLPKPLAQNNFFVYGELSLSGEVFQPEDLREFEASPHCIVLTGQSQEGLQIQRHMISQLYELKKPQTVAADVSSLKPLRPAAGLHFSFPKEQARLIEILALGRHHALLAGASGTGKSTLAKSLSSFLPEPLADDLFKMRADWWPQISPHHSVSAKSLVGGGVPPRPGEVVKAHRGILILDELLEYSVSAQEALREPLEEGTVRISRGMQSQNYKSQFQLLATTNLCPCGQWSPGVDPHCRFSRQRCVSYQQRLSGPFLDRFELLSFFKMRRPSPRTQGIPGSKILAKLEAVRRWKGEQNFKFPRCSFVIREHLFPKTFSSRRREKALERISITLADLDFSPQVKAQHVDEAMELSCSSFDRLNQGF